MKHFLLSTTLIFVLQFQTPASAQKSGLPYDRFTGEITQTTTLQTGQSKEKTYYAVKAWVYKTYPNYREVVKVESLGSGKIVFQGNERIATERFKAFSYRVTVDIKDGNYTCTINNVRTLSPGSPDYTSADTDFSNMGMYGKDIDDIGREISVTKNKKQLAKLHNERRVLKSFLRDYNKSHSIMDLEFDLIQNGLREAVTGTSSLAAK